jgi:O-succinylbenzoic acid--CoA ligase
MHSPWLKLNGISYSLEEIRCGNFLQNDNPTLVFCQEWLSGKDKFELTTSGSTGKPKKIHFTRDQLIASAKLTTSFLGLQAGQTALVCLDTRYIAGRMMLIRALEVRMNLYVVETLANPLAHVPDNLLIDFTAMVPYQLGTILQSDQRDKLNNIKICLIGGARLAEKTKISLSDFQCTFYATYGMTETLSHIALQKLNGINVQDSFKTLPGISLSADQRGCLVILAAHLNDSQIITNDVVEFKGPDSFLYLGRMDGVINSGGVKIFPERIESIVEIVFSELNLTNRFFITGIPDPQFGEKVILCIEGDNLPGANEKKLIQRMRDSLKRFEIPKEIQYIDTFIQTETGKINKPKTVERITST